MIRNNGQRYFYLIAYDLSNNKRRLKLSKLLESLGMRVQGSVFEGWLTGPELDRLVKLGKPLIHQGEDSLRIYPVCRACHEKMILIGENRSAPEPGLVIL